MKPTFLIVGAQKSATTTLHWQLAKHPEVFVSEKKSIHYFSVDDNYKKGDSWYESFFDTDKKIVGETSGLYYYFPYCPERIYRYNPELKLIFCLRNPIDRAFSDYLHEVRKGHECLSFEQALLIEDIRLSKGWWYQKSFGYLAKGRYHEHLERFYDLFPRENILVVFFDDLRSEPESFYQKIFAFLGVSTIDLVNPSLHLNQQKKLLFSPFAKVLQNSKFLKHRWLQHLYAFNHRKSKISVDSTTRQLLQTKLIPEIEQLSKLTGRDLDNWIEGESAFLGCNQSGKV
ncbi:MAG: sulfotransferase [Planctomycetes bacterium]|nr:sulfotransferase [Planctomycetota bacterium]